jgi:putative endonuclease
MSKDLKYYTYVLRSLKFDKTYVGHTNDPIKRLSEHNKGRTVYTSKFKPWKIIHLEVFSSRKEAIKREKYYKSAAGRRKIKLM